MWNLHIYRAWYLSAHTRKESERERERGALPNKRRRKAIGKVPIIESTWTCQNPSCHRQHIFLLSSLFAMRFFLLLLLLLNFYSLWYRNNIFYDRMWRFVVKYELWCVTRIRSCLPAYTHRRMNCNGKKEFRRYTIRIEFQSRKKWKQIKSNRIDGNMK